MRLIALAFAAALGGCVAYGGDRLVPVATQTSASAAFEMSTPVALDAAKGVRITGAVCSNAVHPPVTPHSVRVLRVTASGEINEAGALLTGGPLTTQHQACARYDVQTAWRLAASDRVVVCLRGVEGCPVEPRHT